MDRGEGGGVGGGMGGGWGGREGGDGVEVWVGDGVEV